MAESTTTSREMALDQFLIDEHAPELHRGPDWLTERRQEARASFNDQPLPRRGLHLWRYTDPGKFLMDKSLVSDTSFGENYDMVEQLELQHLKDGHLAALVSDLGGREIQIHRSESELPEAVVIASLSEAAQAHEEIVQKYLYELVHKDTGKFEAMNGALWNDGIFIYVPKNVEVTKPVHLLREAGRNKSAHFARLLVVIEDNARLTIVDEYGGGSFDIADGRSLANSVVELYGGPNSHMRYVPLQRQASGMTSYLTHRARIEQGATMLTVPLAFGGAISKANFGVTMNGEGADSRMYGMLFGTGRQHFDNHTLHHHAVGKTFSDIDYKVVLRDRAVSAYTGLIRIDNGAKVCEAYQENRNLLLNKGTRAETIPELEILNEEVSCSHGATIGPIDPEQIFYLGSRGVDRERAVRMIVGGFVADTLKLVPEDLRERITSFVAQRLEDI